MYRLFIAILLTLVACSTGTVKKPARNISSLNIEKIQGRVRVSNKSFRKLARANFFTSSTCVVSFDRIDYNKTPKFLQKIHRVRDRFNGLFVEAMCGSYTKTRKMAVKRKMRDRMASFFTGGTYSRFEVISECTNGQVLVYQSPPNFNLSRILDPEWCGSHAD